MSYQLWLVQLLLRNYQCLISKRNLSWHSSRCWVLRSFPCGFLLQTPSFICYHSSCPLDSKQALGKFQFQICLRIGHPGSSTRIAQAVTTPAHLPGNVTAGTSVLAGASQKQGNESTTTLGNWDLTPWFASYSAPQVRDHQASLHF